MSERSEKPEEKRDETPDKREESGSEKKSKNEKKKKYKVIKRKKSYTSAKVTAAVVAASKIIIPIYSLMAIYGESLGTTASFMVHNTFPILWTAATTFVATNSLTNIAHDKLVKHKIKNRKKGVMLHLIPLAAAEIAALGFVTSLATPLNVTLAIGGFVANYIYMKKNKKEIEETQNVK